MTNELIIRVLGPPVIELNGRALTPHLSRKAQALLVYLACQQRPVAREVLTTLFWADSSGEQGMTNLRKTLSELRHWLPDHLLAERQTIELVAPFWLDVSELNRLLPKEAPSAAEMDGLATAVALYRGPFLDTISLTDSPDFTLWVTLQHEQIRQLVINALHHLADHCLQQRHYPEGVAYARQWVTMAPLSETASRTLMLLLARSGQAAAALAEYDRCCHQLQAELGVEPTAVTQSLNQRIQTAVAASHSQRAALPEHATPFVGRETELGQLNQHLADPARRWLTITGPGGVGKTRLALQIAAEWAYDFLHGVYFASLAAIDSPATLAATIAAALHAPLTGPEPPQQQLLNYLRQKELLLLLDNAETLLTPALETAADLLPEILQHAPQVRLMVTSRERFNFQAEQVVALAGLPVNDEAGLQLFAERARQVQPDFAATPEALPAIRQICRLVDGLPLGIELAAASLATYSPTEIATGLAQTLDFLQREEVHGRHDGRHHSLRTVFESAWQHLTTTEQTALAALSVFPGGFTAVAAQAIAQAAPSLLLALVGKSMLRMIGERHGDRYQLHQLLRQFAAEKMEDETAVQTRFGTYFARFLQAQEGPLHGRDQQQALQIIDAEIDNIRAAWNWLVENHQATAVSQALSPLHHFYDMRGRFVEGEVVFRLALEQWQNEDERENGFLLARLQARQGFFLERLGNLEAAIQQLQNSLNLLQGADTAEEAFVLNHLGLAFYNQGAYAQAETWYRRSLELSRQAGVADQEANTLLNLGALLREQGQYPAARQMVEESLGLLRRGGDARQMAIGLQVLGSLAEIEGDLAEANVHFRQSLAICQEIDDRMGQAVVCSSLCQIARQQQALASAQAWGQRALTLFQEIGDLWGIAISSVRLGELALALADDAAARKLFQTGLELCQEMGDQRGTAVCLCNLGYVALAQVRLPKARVFFVQAIEIAAAIQFMPLLLKAFTGMAQFYSQTEENKKAMTLATFVQQHPAVDDATRAQAATLRQKLAAQLPPERVLPPANSPDLDAILELLEIERLRNSIS
ncbi:MAG TPA: tetratricopeptide repeat protein [Chloroflexota bacterium]|nr:tetratricopeptide repeat protein [Chloroflexota bacterium]